MCREGEYEQLFAELEKCLSRADSLGLAFAGELIKMSVMEISNNYNLECNQPVDCSVRAMPTATPQHCRRTSLRLIS
jgi:hypothetical protein